MITSGKHPAQRWALSRGSGSPGWWLGQNDVCEAGTAADRALEPWDQERTPKAFDRLPGHGWRAHPLLPFRSQLAHALAVCPRAGNFRRMPAHRSCDDYAKLRVVTASRSARLSKTLDQWLSLPQLPALLSIY